MDSRADSKLQQPQRCIASKRRCFFCSLGIASGPSCRLGAANTTRSLSLLLNANAGSRLCGTRAWDNSHRGSDVTVAAAVVHDAHPVTIDITSQQHVVAKLHSTVRAVCPTLRHCADVAFAARNVAAGELASASGNCRHRRRGGLTRARAAFSQIGGDDGYTLE